MLWYYQPVAARFLIINYLSIYLSINEFNPQMPFTQKIVGHYSKQNLTQFRPLYDTSPGRLPIRKSYLEKRNQNVLTFCQCEGRRRLRKFNS